MSRNEAIAHVLQQLHVDLVSIDASLPDEVTFRIMLASERIGTLALPAPFDGTMKRREVDAYIAQWRTRIQEGQL